MDIKKFIENLGENKEELLIKGTQCKSAEAMLVLAKESGIALDEKGAEELFASIGIKQDVLSDNELDSVAGGSKTIVPGAPYLGKCRGCGYKMVTLPGGRCPKCHLTLGPA